MIGIYFDRNLSWWRGRRAINYSGFGLWFGRFRFFFLFFRLRFFNFYRGRGVFFGLISEVKLSVHRRFMRFEAERIALAFGQVFDVEAKDLALPLADAVARQLAIFGTDDVGIDDSAEDGIIEKIPSIFERYRQAQTFVGRKRIDFFDADQLKTVFLGVQILGGKKGANE